MLALALGFGAVHAVGPGHGKTVMAAYLVGTTGRPRDAVLLGGVVSLMHTASVLILGAVLLRVDRSFATEAAYPALTLLSGLAVTTVGGWLFFRRYRRLRSAPGRGPPPAHRTPTTTLTPTVAMATATVAGGTATSCLAT